MLRSYAFVFGVCLGASSIARADTSADQTQTPTDAEKEARLRLFVKTGDQARLAGRYDEAATAYKLALDIQPDPVISGRFGLVLMKLGQLDRAGDQLHRALERGQGVPLQERQEVTAAYDKAKALTAWVNVNISHAGTTVTCDGEPCNPHRFSSFWRFTKPGEHTLRAQLDGYQEAVQAFTAKPGEEITISITLVPLDESKLPELPSPITTISHETRTFPPYLPTSNIAGASDYDPKEDPSYGEPKETKPVPKKDGPRFSINGGVVTVFGVASWNPALGGVVGVGLRPKEFLSLGIEGRAAWLTTDVATDSQISAMTAGGILSGCGHIRWFFGCGLGYAGVTNVDPSNKSYRDKSLSFAQLGFGARAGIEFRIGSAFIARGNVDVLRLARGIQVAVGNQVVVDQPPVMVSAQVNGGWEF